MEWFCTQRNILEQPRFNMLLVLCNQQCLAYEGFMPAVVVPLSLCSFTVPVGTEQLRAAGHCGSQTQIAG